MKRLNYIVPIVGIAIFSFFYVQHLDVLEKREADRKAAKAKADADEAAKKKEAQVKAKADADRRAAERAAEELKKQQDKEEKHAANLANWNKKIQTNKDNTAKYTKEAAASNAKLEALRAEHEALRRDSFETDKNLALAQIQRRNAELEIQRYVDMVASKADQSVLTHIPTPTPAKN